MNSMQHREAIKNQERRIGYFKNKPRRTKLQTILINRWKFEVSEYKRVLRCTPV